MTDLQHSQEQEQVRVGWWDTLSVVIYFIAMMAAATRLVATSWVRNLDLVQTVAFLGIFVGLTLGRSVFNRWVSFFIGLAYGIIIVPWQLGLTLDEEIEWADRLVIMVNRLRAILFDIFVREDVTDNLFFLLLMAALFWFLSVYSGYQLVRHGNLWRATLPAGLAMFVIQSYDPVLSRRTWYLAFYIFLFLLLLARNYYIHQQRRWQQARTYVPPDAGFDFIRFAFLVAVVIVFMAWNSPVLANTISPIADIYHALEEPWLDAKDRMSYLFASLRATVGLVTDYYPDAQPLGTGSSNSDTAVMRVVAPGVDYPGQRYYWRARVYDFYSAGTWSTTVLDEVNFNPENGDIVIPAGGERTTVEVEITPRMALITMFGPSQPVWFSKAGNLNYQLVDEGAYDIHNVKASPIVRPEETYTVRASLATPTEIQLREAGTNYPQWVLDRYLQLPEEITPRTQLLAQRLAEGRASSYDVAITITAWLRDNMEYLEYIEAPPRNQEPLDWFMFDYRKGFCNYYASSMVVMLRSLGIPARWAVGYAQGNQISGGIAEFPEQLRGQVPELFFDEEKTFAVRQLDAHAWPEVYFPGIGWVEFEPTVSQISIFRPSGIDPSEAGDEDALAGGSTQPEDMPVPDDFANMVDETPLEAVETDPTGRIVLGIISGLAGVGIIVLIVVYRRNPLGVRTWWSQVIAGLKTPLPIQLEFGFLRLGIHPPAFLKRLAYQAQLPLAAKSFLEVNNANERLDLITHPSFTPAERVGILSRRVPDLSAVSKELLEEYHKETYNNEKPDEYIVVRAGNKIKYRSRQVWLNSLQDRLKEPFKKRASNSPKSK